MMLKAWAVGVMVLVAFLIGAMFGEHYPAYKAETTVSFWTDSASVCWLLMPSPDGHIHTLLVSSQLKMKTQFLEAMGRTPPVQDEVDTQVSLITSAGTYEFRCTDLRDGGKTNNGETR